MERKIIAICKTCGATAYFLTKKNKISEEDRFFECNKCVWKKLKKQWKQPKVRQAALF